MDGADRTPDIRKTALPLMWQPTTLKLMLVLFYTSTLVGLFIGPTAIRTDRQLVEFALSCILGAVMVTVVWPFYRRTLADQILKRGGAWQERVCFVIVLLPPMLWLLHAPPRPTTPPPIPLAGFLTGAWTFFFRLYRWLDRLPE